MVYNDHPCPLYLPLECSSYLASSLGPVDAHMHTELIAATSFECLSTGFALLYRLPVYGKCVAVQITVHYRLRN